MVGPVIGHFIQDLRAIFQMMEGGLGGGKRYFGGSRLGLSDLNMSFRFDVCEQRGWFDGEKYPKVEEWKRRVEEREGWKNAMEKGCGYDLEMWT